MGTNQKDLSERVWHGGEEQAVGGCQSSCQFLPLSLPWKSFASPGVCCGLGFLFVCFVVICMAAVYVF